MLVLGLPRRLRRNSRAIRGPLLALYTRDNYLTELPSGLRRGRSLREETQGMMPQVCLTPIIKGYQTLPTPIVCAHSIMHGNNSVYCRKRPGHVRSEVMCTLIHERAPELWKQGPTRPEAVPSSTVRSCEASCLCSHFLYAPQFWFPQNRKIGASRTPLARQTPHASEPLSTMGSSPSYALSQW